MFATTNLFGYVFWYWSVCYSERTLICKGNHFFLLIISMMNILREIELKQLRKNYHSQKIDQFYPQIKYD